jgi:predicted aldo/keto reductase-like oxidoreductase
MGGIPLTRPSEEEAIRVVQRALDLGVNFIDTARGYDPSEERVGKALATTGWRDHVIVATKSHGRDKATALEHLEQSLQNLQIDYVDLWQLHNVSNFELYEQVLGSDGAMEAAQEALQAGKIRHVGISSHNIDVALKAVASGLFETIQFPFNFIANEAADELIPLARECDVGFIAMKPFAGGRVRDANLAIKYLLQFDSVVPDPGIEKSEEIEEIVDIVANGPWELTAQERRGMERIRAELGPRFCRQCQYCLPCPEGVNVPMLMITQVMWKLWPAQDFFPWVGSVVEGARGCIECGECETKCPYHLPIREMIIENIAFYERVAAEHSLQQDSS